MGDPVEPAAVRQPAHRDPAHAQLVDHGRRDLHAPEEDDLRHLAESRLADHRILVEDLQHVTVLADARTLVLHVQGQRVVPRG